MRILIYRKDLMTIRSLTKDFKLIESGTLFCECTVSEADLNTLNLNRIWCEIL